MPGFDEGRDYYAFKKLSFSKRLFGHIGTVLTHKKHVRHGCFKMGLYMQGIFHDMSKFSPTEFIPSVKYYSGTFSPNATDRKLTGVSTSWLHHKGRNKHHFEYWTDYMPEAMPHIAGCRMPLKYVAEMVADRYAACVAYNGDKYTCSDAWNYYSKGRDHIIIDDDTRAVLEAALIKMRDEGEDAAFAYMKRMLKITKGRDYDASITKKA
ncbi:MAG: DUF5662 family protein [Lachnospiraceae bacterium]|nr:DUF5662 family protein [Lachnospiraceae bacterium]